jgi:hypothetical protein
MRFVKKNAQNVCSLTHSLSKLMHNHMYVTVELISTQLWATFVNKKLPKVKNNPMGENSPNLDTLIFTPATNKGFWMFLLI